jgi:large subunit ribosomal protein L35
MPKMKTNSSAKKRFSKSGGKKGLFKRAKAYRRHLLTKKSRKTKRDLRKTGYFTKGDAKHIAALLPY